MLHNPRLKILDASGNAFASLKDVEILKDMPMLVNLSFQGSPLAQSEGYTDNILQLVPRYVQES
jgi:hypothetical protein